MNGTPTPTPSPSEFPVIFTYKSGPTNAKLIGLDCWNQPILKPPSFQYMMTKNKRYNILLNTTFNPMTEPTLMAIVLDTTDSDVVCVKVDNQSSLCQKQSVPGINIINNSTYGLKEIEFYIPYSPITPTLDSFDEWVNYHDTSIGLYNYLPALLEIIDGYLGFKNIGFIVTLSDLLDSIDYYLGFK